MSDPIVIVGSGLAGYTLARELRKHAADLPLVVITGDAGDFYSKPMISNALAGNKSAGQLAMKSAVKMAEELRARVLTHTRVISIDAGTHTLRHDAGTQAYSKLVLALGADTIDSGIEGDRSRLLSVNDLADYARLRDGLEGKKSVAVIGAGLIGCEFANDLISIGLDVTVIDPAAWPLSRLLPEAAGARMRLKLEEQGVRFCFGVTAKTIAMRGGSAQVALSDGSTIQTDLVLSAIGLRSRTALANAAGLAVNRGIVVNRLLQTSNPDIYALGDCAEVEGLVLPFVMPIMQAARALGATLAGNPSSVSYPAMPVVVKTPACPTVVSPAAPGSQGEWLVEFDDNALRARFVHEGRTLGFALMGAAVTERQVMATSVPPVLA